MKYFRGDTVLVNYPFASEPGGKIRPALIVQCNANNQKLHNTLIVQITTRIQFAEIEATQVLVTQDSDDGKRAGLLRDSAIACEMIFTVRQDAILRRIGNLNEALMRKVDDALRASLDIS